MPIIRHTADSLRSGRTEVRDHTMRLGIGVFVSVKILKVRGRTKGTILTVCIVNRTKNFGKTLESLDQAERALRMTNF